MKTRFLLIPLCLLAIFSCKKEPDVITNPPPWTSRLDSLPYENDHLSLALVSTQAPQQIADMAFVNHDRGFAINYDGEIFRTDDGGVNWTPSYVPTGSWNGRDIEFLNDQTGVA